jgi:hypothetical protein
MPNKRFSKFPAKGPKTGERGKHADRMPEKTASWGGLPGKAQPQDRSGGTKRLKVYAKSEGL